MPNTPFSVRTQYLLPRLGLTRFAGLVANWRGGPCTTWLIRDFIRRYSVDMQEAVQPDPTRYRSFNDFFTRALRPEVRPLATDDYVSPVDGAISQLGPIERDQIFQAKGRHYSTTALLGGDPALATAYQDGVFATLYLSPRDYHRVHMPCAGTLTRMIHVPGDLFSVNPATAQGIDGLFARNERVVCLFESAHGPFVLVLVGATIVGSIATTWHGVVNTTRPRELREWRYAGPNAPTFAKGEEMGRFLLGSTVVLLFPKDRLHLNPAWTPAAAIRQGASMGNAA